MRRVLRLLALLASRFHAWRRLGTAASRFSRPSSPVEPRPGQSAAPGRRARAGIAGARDHDYKPRTTLVVPEHPVPRAKFPVIDIHGHPADANLGRRLRARRRGDGTELNIRVLVNLAAASGDRLKAGLDAIRGEQVPGPHGAVRQRRLSATSARVWREGARRSSKQDIKAGAQGSARSSRTSGCGSDEPTARRLKLDDPELDPIWAAVRPSEGPGPDPHRRAAGVLRAARLSQRTMARDGALSDRRFRPSRLPALRGADGRARPDVHEASEHDVHRRRISDITRTTSARLGKLFDRLPNLYAEVGADPRTTSAASRARRTTSSSSTRTGSCSARTASSPTSIRTSGGRSRPRTSTSTTTATTMRSGSCTAWICPTTC